MPGLSQAQLERKVDILVSNGGQTTAQAVIAGVGYTPEKLNKGQTLLNAIRTGRATRKTLLANQKKATQAEATARQAAHKELVSFAETARTLFADDEATLTQLNLITRYKTVTSTVPTTAVDGEAEKTVETTRVAVQPPKATAETISRWQQQLAGAQALEADKANLLAAAGWPTERLTAALALVNAYAAADTAQQAAIQAHQQAATQFKTDLKALRTWYTQATRLIRIAIKDQDPANQASLKELLGL